MIYADMIREDAAHIRGVHITVYENPPWVHIQDTAGKREPITLDVREAALFVEQRDMLLALDDELTKDLINLHLAKLYITCLWR